MVFSSVIFLFLFLPFFLICYFLCKNNKKRNLVLLIFSLGFYAWGEPYYIFLMLLMLFVNYHFTKKMGRDKKTLISLIVFNLLVLFSFKYLNFFIDNINGLFSLNIKNVNLSLPIGISFYTFQALSYVVDVYKGKVKAQKSFINLGCYICAFPQLIAGPIVRYTDIEKEITGRKTNMDDFADGIRRFIIGLSKKVLIANNVAYICDVIFAEGIVEGGVFGMVIAILSYTLQIYFDFSGYSDMAIGLGRMLGFHYNENFNLPYMAESVTDFWRRWHISLSSFFKDYVYIPLGGNKGGTFKHIRNILIVWMLTGLWHGNSWNFIIWGLYYGIILLIEKYFVKDNFNKVFHRIITIFVICIGWLIFRETNFNDLGLSFKALFGVYGIGNIKYLYYLGIFSFRFILSFIFGIILSTDLIKIKDGLYKDILLIILFILSIIMVVVSSYNPFIYFKF